MPQAAPGSASDPGVAPTSDPGPVAALAGVLRQPNLRRAEVSFGLSIVAQTCWVALFLVELLAVAGPIGPGLFVLIRQVVGSLTAPGFAALAERWPRERVLAAATVVRAGAALGAMPIIANHGPAGALYGIAAVEGAAASAPNAIQIALLPWLAERPAQLGAANALNSIFAIGGVMMGGVIDAVLIHVQGSRAVLISVVVLFLAAVALLLRIRGVRTNVGDTSRWSFTQNLVGGVRYLHRNGDPRALVFFLAIPALLLGVGQTFASTISHDLLHQGSSGTPILVALGGAGGFVGGLLSSSSAARPGLARLMATGTALAGAGTLLIAGLPTLIVVILALCMTGVGIAYGTVLGSTLLQRVVPNEHLGPTVGVSGLLSVGSVGIGGIAAAALVWLVGTRWALALTGALVMVAACWAHVRLRRIEPSLESGGPAVTVIEDLGIFRPLSVAMKREIARKLRAVDIAAGQAVIRQGDPPREFYVVERGRLEVLNGTEQLATLGEGDCFGEVALLHDTVRTATVRSLTPARVWCLARADFLAAVTGNLDTLALAQALAESRSRTDGPSSAERGD